MNKTTSRKNHDDINNRSGILYIASGKRHFEEAMASLKTLRQVSPLLPAAIVTDQSHEQVKLPKKLRCRIIIRRDMSYSLFDKAFFINLTPFRKTLLLDTDTYILSDLSDLFDVLDVFDLALVLDTSRGKIYYPPPKYDDPPKTYRMLRQYNDGFILFKKNTRVSKFLSEYKKYSLKEYKLAGPSVPQSFTQGPLVMALGHSLVRLITLPYEYNYRLTWGAPDAVDPIRIVHGRKINQKLLAEINKGISTRQVKDAYKFLPSPKSLRICLTNYDYCLRPYSIVSVLGLVSRIHIARYKKIKSKLKYKYYIYLEKYGPNRWQQIVEGACQHRIARNYHKLKQSITTGKQSLRIGKLK